MRHHFRPVSMAVINKSINNKCWQGCGERETLLHCWWEGRLVQPLWKAVWRYLKKIKNGSAFWPSDPTSENTSEETKTLIQKNISTLMYLAALLIITKIWKPSKCPSVHEWIKQLQDIYTMEYYSTIKNKKILPFETVWMDLENIMLSEISK